MDIESKDTYDKANKKLDDDLEIIDSGSKTKRKSFAASSDVAEKATNLCTLWKKLMVARAPILSGTELNLKNELKKCILSIRNEQAKSYTSEEEEVPKKKLKQSHFIQEEDSNEVTLSTSTKRKSI
jgi:hypothetical protein